MVKNSKYFVILFLVFYSLSSFASNFTANISRKDISMGQTATLTLSIKNQKTNLAPNLAPLNKYFNILGTATSQQTNIINNKSESKTTWTILLSPKKTGKVTIPAIQLAQFKTKPINITISKSKNIKINNFKNKNIFIKTSLNKNTAYPNQPIIYTFKLFYNQAISNGSLSQPKAIDTEIKPFGKQKRYQQVINNKNYEILEAKYIIQPNKSGKLIIHSPVLNGYIPIENNSQNNLFYVPTQPITRRGPDQVLDVMSIPTSAKNHLWLPSDKITLKQSWSPLPLQFKIGEPITRTITIKAQNLQGDDIPALTSQNIKDINIYPSQPIISTTITNNTLIGTRQEKIVYIPTKPGETILPEIKFTYFNTKKNKIITANLPSQVLTIMPSGIQNQINKTIPNLPKPEFTKQNNITNKTNTNNYWEILAVLFGLAWIITLSLFFYKKYNKNNLKFIKQSCDTNNPKACERALCEWAGVNNLNQLKVKLNNPELAEQLDYLVKILYQDQADQVHWNGRLFYKIFKKSMKNLNFKNNKKNNGDGLPEINSL